MKYIKILASFLIITILLSCVAFADGGELSFETPVEQEGFITISGTCDVADGTDVTLTMIKRADSDPDTKIEDELYDYDMAPEEIVKNVYVRQTKAENNAFTFNFKPSFENGIYDIYVNIEGNSDAAEDIYVYIDGEEKKQLLESINNADEEDIGEETDKDIHKIINENLDLAFIKIKDAYNALPSAQKDICKLLCQYEEDFETLDEVADYMEKLLVIFNIVLAKGDFNDISNNASTLGINGSKAEKIFNDGDDDFKENVYDDFKGISVENDFSFLTEFANIVYLNLLADTKNVELTPGVMEKIRDDEDTDIDVSGYFSSSKKDDIEEEITGKEFTKKELEEKIEKINDKDDDSGKKSNSSSGSYPSGNIDMTSSPIVQPPAQSNTATLIFPDVDRTHWAYEAINAMYASGAVAGDENGYFNPNNMITREEYAKIVCEMFKFTSDSASCSFDDVAKDRWSYKYIASLYNIGVISGKSETSFAPYDPITREQAAHILFNIVNYKNNIIEKKRDIIEFVDQAEISDYALVSVMSLYAGEIISGYGDLSIKPQNNITRAESAQLIINLFKSVR